MRSTTLETTEQWIAAEQQQYIYNTAAEDVQIEGNIATQREVVQEQAGNSFKSFWKGFQYFFD